MLLTLKVAHREASWRGSSRARRISRAPGCITRSMEVVVQARAKVRRLWRHKILASSRLTTRGRNSSQEARWTRIIWAMRATCSTRLTKQRSNIWPIKSTKGVVHSKNPTLTNVNWILAASLSKREPQMTLCPLVSSSSIDTIKVGQRRWTPKRNRLRHPMQRARALSSNKPSNKSRIRIKSRRHPLN